MRVVLLGLSLVLSACGAGTATGNAYCYSDGPIASNLVLAPGSAVVGEGGGNVVVNATIDYRWRDSAKIILVEYRIVDAGGNQIVSSDIHKNLKGSGTFAFSVPVSTKIAQIYTVRVRAMDECFETSKWEEARFDVIAVAAMAGKTGYATAQLNGLVYFIGGQDEYAQISDTLLQYDPATQQVQNKAPMPDGRKLAAAATHNGIIYVFGGSAHGFEHESTFAYDSATDSWTSVAPMSSPAAGAAAIAVDGTIYVEGNNGMHSYDPVLDLWRSHHE